MSHHLYTLFLTYRGATKARNVVYFILIIQKVTQENFIAYTCGAFSKEFLLLL